MSKKLEALEEIRTLKHKYWRLMDQFIEDQIGDVFSEEAVCDFGDFGYIKGRANIVEFFRSQVYPMFDMMVHMGHNPEIQLTSETTANGTWLYECYQLTKEPVTGIWLTGWYDDRYVVEDGVWKIEYSTGTYYFNTDMEEQWAKRRFVPYPPERDVIEEPVK